MLDRPRVTVIGVIVVVPLENTHPVFRTLLGELLHVLEFGKLDLDVSREEVQVGGDLLVEVLVLLEFFEEGAGVPLHGCDC